MLGVSFKIPDPIDIGKPIQNYIKARYSKQEGKDAQFACNNVSDVRNNLHKALYAQQRETICTNLENYLSLLNLLESKFPFGKRSGKASAIEIPFIWNDAFVVRKKSTSKNLGFEKAACIFNLGSVYSNRGVDADRGTADGLKNAAKSFGQAAGVFAHIQTMQDQISDSGAKDMSANCIGMLSALMLGQAQACLYEAAVIQKMSAKVVAKVAAGASALYEQAFNATKDDKALMQLLDQECKYKWRTHVVHQGNVFRALAHYWAAKNEHNDEEYGIEISHFREAASRIQKAKSVSAGLVPTADKFRNDANELIIAAKALAEKDNETVYHKPLPSECPDIERKILAKATPFYPPSPPAQDPFGCLGGGGGGGFGSPSAPGPMMAQPQMGFAPS